MPSPLFAVFGDVHSNLEALTAVLADMENFPITAKICLGDTVGYAANPGKCLERIRGLGCRTLKGNHDAATAENIGVEDMRDIALSGIEFAQKKLSAEQCAFLKGLPLSVRIRNVEFVHASLNAPDEWRYVMEGPDARDHFEAQSQPLCFCGHTHVPMVWHLSGAGQMMACRGQGRIRWPSGGKTLINAGSVGQPRDLNPFACYAICDPRARWVEFRRVEYDIAKTRRKIMRAKLPRFIAQRLSLGH